jgi:hypothetical protein
MRERYVERVVVTTDTCKSLAGKFQGKNFNNSLHISNNRSAIYNIHVSISETCFLVSQLSCGWLENRTHNKSHISRNSAAKTFNMYA